MYNTQTWNAPTIALTANNVGQRAYSRLNSGKKNHSIKMRIRGTLTLAGGPGTAIINAGSAWAAVDFVGLEDNGRDVALLNPRMCRAMSQMISSTPLDLGTTRLSNLANGAYDLAESITIPFSWPRSVSPVETSYVEPDPRNALQAFVVWNNVGGGAAGVQGGLVQTPGTAVWSAVTVTVQQVLDTDLSVKSLFSPYYRVIQEPITAAVTNFPIYLKGAKFLRGILIQQDNLGAGEVDDIVTSLIIRGDENVIAGPQAILYSDLVFSIAQPQFGGNILAAGFSAAVANVSAQPSRPVYLPWEFTENGRLSNALNPNLDLNFRLEVTGLPSVTTGATASSVVRVLMMELERFAGITADVIPFPV